MTQAHNLVVTYWHIKPERDHHNALQMKAAGLAGVYEPLFHGGEKKMLRMQARFDASDQQARDAAVRYAISNVSRMHPGESFVQAVYLNGQELRIDNLTNQKQPV